MAGDALHSQEFEQNLNNMILKKNDAKDEKEKLNILIDFATKFTLLPTQWSEFISLSKQCQHEIIHDDYCHLYSSENSDTKDKHIAWSNPNFIMSKLEDYNCAERFQLAEETLSFPHAHLETIYERLQYFSVKTIAKEVTTKFFKNKLTFKKIKNSENEIDEWLECMKEIESEEAVIANMELKLGQEENWKNAKLWKFYFNFLEQHNFKEILEVYQKYTRLFINDNKAIEEYRAKIEEYSNSTNPQTRYWIDTIKHEIDFGSDLQLAYRILDRALKSVIEKSYNFDVKDKKDLEEKLKKFKVIMNQIERKKCSVAVLKSPHINVKHVPTKCAVYFQTSNQQQTFCFHYSFVQYFLKNANATTLRKLYSSCKFFYSRKNAPLCYKLEICSDKSTKYFNESLCVNEKDVVTFAGLQNLQVYSLFIVPNCSDTTTMTKVLSKLASCKIENTLAFGQDISVSDFKFLLSSNFSGIIYGDVNIRETDGTKISGLKLFEILQPFLPLKRMEFVNERYFIVSSYEQKELVSRWKPMIQFFRFEMIYFENQICKLSDLRDFINYEVLKHFTLKTSIVKDDDGTVMDKEQLEKIVKESVNPKNNVYIGIL